MFADRDATAVTRKQRAYERFSESIATPGRIAWEDWRMKAGLSIISLFVVVAFVAWISSSTWWVLEGITIVDEPISNQGPTRLAPFENLSYPLGTDIQGRGLLAGIVHATPVMIKMILAGAVFSSVLATAVGTVAGYKGGTTERVLMTISDVAMTIPGLPLVIVLAVLFEPQNPWLIGIIITINVWAGLARTIHSQVLTLREHSYVEASRTMGIGTRSIIQKDILPNLMPYVTVNFVYAARRVIYDSVALYFLGVLTYQGIENWGVMMFIAYDIGGALFNPNHTYMLLVPMLPIVLLSLGLILFAQGTDRLFNPRVRTRQAGETMSEEDDENATVIAQ